MVRQEDANDHSRGYDSTRTDPSLVDVEITPVEVQTFHLQSRYIHGQVFSRLESSFRQVQALELLLIFVKSADEGVLKVKGQAHCSDST